MVTQWEGVMRQDPPLDLPGSVSGPLVTIRNPRWTEEYPYQDILIMIFTKDQWKLVDGGLLVASAAPFPPGEIGRNDKYVFALPPRMIGYADEEGQIEVANILKRNPLHPLKAR